VLGLMPHPENHIVARQHPSHRRCTDPAIAELRLGLQLFRSGVSHAEQL
jgi:phosphoribosylformylglycinamidine (FGAM) synthase-like amidotransferase family enzyme